MKWKLIKYYILTTIDKVNPCTKIEGEDERLIYTIVTRLTTDCPCCTIMRGVAIGVALTIGVIAWL